MKFITYCIDRAFQEKGDVCGDKLGSEEAF